MIQVSWGALKDFMTSKSMSAQFLEDDEFLNVFVADGSFCASALINKTIQTEDLEDFDTNYRSKANKTVIHINQPFAAKVLPSGKGLFKRVVGISQALDTGANEFTWEQDMYPHAKFLGVEIIGGETGDNCSLYVLDTAEGTFSGVPNYPLNQFGFSVNVAKDFYKRMAEYDADIYQGLKLKFVYNSVSEKTIYMNFDLNEVRS